MYLKDFECDLLIIREIFPLFLIPLLIHWNCSIFLKGYYYYVDGVILHHLDNLVSTHEVLFTLIPGSYCYKINSIKCNRRLPWWLSSEESACDAGDVSLIPRLRRSPGKGNGNPLQDSCLGNSMDRRAWQATVHDVSKSWTWLSN